MSQVAEAEPELKVQIKSDKESETDDNVIKSKLMEPDTTWVNPPKIQDLIKSVGKLTMCWVFFKGQLWVNYLVFVMFN